MHILHAGCPNGRVREQTLTSSALEEVLAHRTFLRDSRERIYQWKDTAVWPAANWWIISIAFTVLHKQDRPARGSIIFCDIHNRSQ
jgi:hypothetical protein